MSDFATVKRKHLALFDEVVSSSAENATNPDKLKARVEDLLKEMAAVSARVTSMEDYMWLQDAVTEWSVTGSSILNSPIDVKLPPPAQTLAVPSRERKVWSKEALKRWRDKKAFEIYKSRVLAKYYAKSEAEILAQEKSTPEEYAADGHQATIYLGTQVLDGELDFVSDFTRESYFFLEGDCWLQQIREIKAYLRWRDADHEGEIKDWGDTEARASYYLACEEIRNRALRVDLKGSQTEFEKVSRYLEERYLVSAKRGSSRVWLLDSRKAHPLIAVKARRLCELTGNPDNTANWFQAEEYARAFYSNIIPAVLTDSDESVKVILDLLHFGDKMTGLDLANCFEAAIAIHFLNAATVERLLYPSKVAADAAVSGSENRAGAAATMAT